MSIKIQHGLSKFNQNANNSFLVVKLGLCVEFIIIINCIYFNLNVFQILMDFWKLKNLLSKSIFFCPRYLLTTFVKPRFWLSSLVRCKSQSINQNLKISYISYISYQINSSIHCQYKNISHLLFRPHLPFWHHVLYCY